MRQIFKIRFIDQLSAFSRGLFLAAAVAALTPPLAPASAASDEEQVATGASIDFNKEDATLYIDWSGPIVAGMADDLRAAFGEYGAVLHRAVLFLDSAGGQVEAGNRIIEVLDEIKQTHRLTTVVLHGKLCASMCIPIFLQGQERLAARASLWIFHEAAQRQANGEARTDTAETWRLFRKYYLPAGVSMHWLKTIAPMIEDANLWQTGGDLIDAKTGIVTHVLGNATERTLAAPPAKADHGLESNAGQRPAMHGIVKVQPAVSASKRRS